MASSAIPVIFPWQEIDGEPHWDGGVAVNTPLLPALERGAREVLVVLFAPLVRGGRAGALLSMLPKARPHGARVFESVPNMVNRARAAYRNRIQ